MGDEENPVNRRFSPEDAERAEMADQQAWSSLIDGIVGSRSQQGRYFFRVGEKTPANSEQFEPGKDRRMIVFRSPVPISEGGSPRYIIVTQDGPYVVDSGDPEFPKRMEELEERKNEGHYQPPSGESGPSVFTAGYGSHEKILKFPLMPLKDVDVVTRAIKKSIEDTESPFVERMRAANEHTKQADTLGQFIKDLPPRG